MGRSNNFLLPDTRYIVKKTQYNEIVLAMNNHGFVVSWIGNDGAIECRSATKLLCTMTARELLEDVFRSSELAGLPLNTKIASETPKIWYHVW